MALKDSITYKDIIEKIGCQNIFEHYFGNFNFNDNYNSVFRVDKKGSTGFYVTKNGNIIYHDFRTGDKYNCVKFVQKLYNLSFKEAINHIAVTFGLIKGNINGFTPVKIKQLNPIKKKEKSVFKVYPRPFTKQDLLWWGQYSITEKELIENQIYSVYRLVIKNYDSYTKSNELRFAYLLKDSEGNGYFKIYSPLSIDRKWLFNASLNLVFGLERLEFKSDTLIITKSVKDYIVLKKYFTDVIALQNEGKASLDPNTARALKKCYKRIIVWFDSDRPGLCAANYYKKTYGFIPFYIGSKKNTIWRNIIEAKKNKVKDPSDFVKVYGIENFTKFINKYEREHRIIRNI